MLCQRRPLGVIQRALRPCSDGFDGIPLQVLHGFQVKRQETARLYKDTFPLRLAFLPLDEILICMRLSYSSLAPWRMAVAGFLLSITASLIGCATSPASPTSPTPTSAQTAGITGGLLVVRLERVKEPPPESIVLEVGSTTKSGKLQFTGRLSQNTAGEYADYLVALPLSPDQYLLTGLNSSGIPNSSDFVLKAPFTVSASAPDYLGRLVLSTDLTTAQTRLRVEDHYQEDTALFLSVLSKLKDLPIGNALIQASPMILRPAESPTQSTTSSLASTAKSGNLIELTPLTSDAASLLVPGDRAAFKKFLQQPFPRAFVTNHAGAQAMAGGSTAAETALSRCNSRARGKECQLFAINDMLVTPDKCAPAASNSTARHTASSDCDPTDHKANTGGKTTNGNAPQVLSGVPTAGSPPADASQTLKTNPGLEQLLRAGSKK